MRFTPHTKEQLDAAAAERRMFPAGRYPFEVAEASEGKGKQSGKPYIKLRLIVYVGDTERTLYDYLTEAMPEKMHSFCEATGLQQHYADGDLAAENCAGRQGWVYVAQGKPKGDYPAKNEAREYFATAEPSNGIDDSDCPF